VRGLINFVRLPSASHEGRGREEGRGRGEEEEEEDQLPHLT